MTRVCMVAYTHYETDPRVRREAEALVRAGYAVDFVALKREGQASHEVIEGVDVFRLNQDRYRGGSGVRYMGAYGKFLLRAGWWLFRHSHRRAHRLIHVNTMPDFMVLCALWPQVIHRVPVILDIHDVMPEIFAGKFEVSLDHWKIRLLRAQEVWSTRVATAVLTAEHVKAKVLGEHGVNPAKVSVLLNLPDEGIFGSPMEPAAPEDTDCFRMVYHGTLAPRLGLDIAIRAIDSVRAEMDALGPWRLEIIGEGDHRAGLIALRDELGLGEHVTFSEGFVQTHTLPDHLRGAALGVVPSRAQADTALMLPTKLLEYAHLGIPAIVRSTRAIEESFEPDQVVMMETEEPAAWGQEILALRRDTARRQAIARRAREFAQDHRWETHQGDYVALVERLIAGERPPWT